MTRYKIKNNNGSNVLECQLDRCLSKFWRGHYKGYFNPLGRANSRIYLFKKNKEPKCRLDAYLYSHQTIINISDFTKDGEIEKRLIQDTTFEWIKK